MRSCAMFCLLALLTARSVSAQATGRVVGSVRDASGTAVPGASVSVAGTGRGALADASGRYTIEGVPAGTHQVRAAAVGHAEATRAVTVAAGQTATADFQLQPSVVQLEGVVAVGYGTQRKRDVTGSVSSVNVGEARAGATASVAQVLQGRVAGVQVTQSSAEPGGGVSVRVRGTTSINADNEPLYVIDGLPIDNTPAAPGTPIYNTRPRNPLNSLSPDDIQSIEVLKDASATAIYGSRGANGVVMITTKSGTRGAFSVDYDGYTGVQDVVREMEMLSAPEYMALLNDLRRDMRQPAEFSQEQIAATGNGTNWQRELFRTAPVTNHHLSFSGGGENGRFYAALGLFDQEGVTISSGMKRYTGRANMEQTAGRLKLGMNVNASYIEDDNIPIGTNVNEAGGAIQAALFQDPTMGTGIVNGAYEISPFVNVENPLALANGVDDFTRSNRTFGSAFAEYTLLPGLNARINLGTDRQNSRRDFYISTLTKRGRDNRGLAEVRSNERESNLGEFTVNYGRDLGDSQRIELLGGSTYQSFGQTSLIANSNGFLSDAFRFNNLAAGERETFDVGSGRSRNQLLSYLGRVNYALFDRYLFTAAFRADGSSRFGEDSKFGYFPSAALAWRVADEPFMANQSLFDDLKLRVSYGITGNQEIGNYNSLVLLGVQGRAYFNETAYVGIAPTQVPNPDLRWETTRQFDAGVDFGLLGNRITGAADYFVKNTTDLLLDLPIPSTTGFNSMLQNVGSVHNHGWELVLNTENLTGELGWTSSLNLSAIRNRATDLAGLPRILQGSLSFVRDFSILEVGQPLNSYYGYIVDGIFQLDDNIAASPQPLAQPGELKFRDLNGDGKITSEDRTILGSPFPDYTFGLSNTLTYGPFELDAFLQGSLGAEMLNLNTIESENPVSFRRNRLQKSYRDRWTPTNPTNANPSGLPVRVVYGGTVNSRAVEDASFVRLRTVELRYHLPTTRLNFLRSGTVYLSGQNLWTSTDYTGFDPEVNSFGDSNVRADYGSYPAARTIMVGVRMGL